MRRRNGDTCRRSRSSSSTPHVYRYGGLTNGAFVVGSDGIAVIDGQICGSNETQWLRDELAKRLPRLYPWKYTVLSHDPRDAHLRARGVQRHRPLAISHVNAKGHIIPREAPHRHPQVTFDERMQLDLGGIEVVLFYLGPTHTDNLIQVHIPAEKGADRGRLRARRQELGNAGAARLESRQFDPRVTATSGAWRTSTSSCRATAVTDAAVVHLHVRDFLVALKERVLEQMVAGKGIEEIPRRP